MKKEVLKYLKLISGLILCAIGIVTILNSNLGLSPWDVLNQGLNRLFGITLGEANLFVGAFVVLFSILLKQPIGSGTVLNLLLVGIFIDTCMYLDFLPKSDNIIFRICLLVVGIIIFSYGCYLYISTGMGCGPRDGLMIILTKKTKYSLSQIKTVIEIVALSTGFILGGFVGVGTIISSLCVGPLIQFFFKINNKDVKELEHRSIFFEMKSLKNYISKKN